MSDSFRKVFWELLQFQDVLLMTEERRETPELSRRKFSLLGCEHLLQLILFPHTRYFKIYGFIFLSDVRLWISRN